MAATATATVTATWCPWPSTETTRTADNETYEVSKWRTWKATPIGREECSAARACVARATKSRASARKD